jgi:hypothetical protein
VDALLAQARARLRAEFVEADKLPLHDVLRDYEMDSRDATYAEAARRAGKTESAIRTDIFRFRKRFHQLVREEVTRTVGDANEVDDEIRHLLKVIGA